MSTDSITRTIIASHKNDIKTTQIIRETLPPLEHENEIRLKIEKVGLSANNKFYIDSGEEQPFNFFKAWPITKEDKEGDEKNDLVNVPAWGVGTVVASKHPGVPVGQQLRGDSFT